jgi:uncharacterized protein (DUF58 family)
VLHTLPARRLLWLLAGAAPLWLLHPGAALLVDGVILLVALADARLAPGDAAVEVRRRVPARLALGAEAEVALELRNATERPLRLRVTDDVPPELVRQGEDTWERTLGAGGEARIRYRVRAEGRGATTVGDVHLRVRGPLGLVWRQHRVARADPVVVQPGIGDLRRHRLLGRRRLRDAGVRSVRERGEGGLFESLREYTRGDDPRSLDWKATARRGSLMVRRWEAERSQNVLLAIDAGRLMSERVGDRERIDHALSAALLLADVATAHGDRVGLLVFADRVQQFLPPRRAPLSLYSDALAAVEPRMVESNYPAAFAYLAAHLRRRSLLVLFTDVIDAHASAALVAHLGRSAARHLPLAVALRNPDLETAATLAVEDEAGAFRRAAAEELLQARAHALAAMQRAGVRVADVQPRHATPGVVSRYLEIKRRGML